MPARRSRAGIDAQTVRVESRLGRGAGARVRAVGHPVGPHALGVLQRERRTCGWMTTSMRSRTLALVCHLIPLWVAPGRIADARQEVLAFVHRGLDLRRCR